MFPRAFVVSAGLVLLTVLAGCSTPPDASLMVTITPSSAPPPCSPLLSSREDFVTESVRISDATFTRS